MSLHLPRRLNLYRRYPYWAKERCIFVHVPKAAGTSMNFALYGRTLGHYSIAEIQRAFPRLVERSFVFSIVRSPFTRLYSAYRFAKVGRTADMGVRDPAQYRVPEFRSFESFVLDWLMLQDLNRVDQIFRPQTSFICVDGAVAVDLLIRVEELTQAIPILERALNRTIVVQQRNVTPNAVALRGILTTEVREAIMALYRRDFEVLGYPTDPNPGMPVLL